MLLDSDLAKLYGVATKVLNQTVNRQAERFPADFRFQITREELTNLKSQIVTSSFAEAHSLHGGLRHLPWAFTEHGALMAAMLLRSPHAVAMSVYVVRAFVRMREELLAHSAVLKRLAQIDKKLLEHDIVLRDVVEKLLPLLSPAEPTPKRRIGFHSRES